ncbi:hypothetical protein [Mastigocoleus sp. MO_188.B34]|nr:hypothetical protein [Mastigocoleus sp. MO_188.B34]
MNLFFCVFDFWDVISELITAILAIGGAIAVIWVLRRLLQANTANT